MVMPISMLMSIKELNSGMSWVSMYLTSFCFNVFSRLMMMKSPLLDLLTSFRTRSFMYKLNSLSMNLDLVCSMQCCRKCDPMASDNRYSTKASSFWSLGWSRVRNTVWKIGLSRSTKPSTWINSCSTGEATLSMEYSLAFFWSREFLMLLTILAVSSLKEVGVWNALLKSSLSLMSIIFLAILERLERKVEFFIVEEGSWFPLTIRMIRRKVCEAYWCLIMSFMNGATSLRNMMNRFSPLTYWSSISISSGCNISLSIKEAIRTNRVSIQCEAYLW
ncbi:hypothetical protein WICPIJ_004364 [Wickerhamomyces pijperi]|uniref:Uncharacterized protein n=1 Tax=Wickerhamomyces pijperi TaxID=599730 RepID=A0A9P8Q5I7_WICPI|nr:hypothetical protein WICPIJ_004364 [Wickerhamomyces pijperi]